MRIFDSSLVDQVDSTLRTLYEAGESKRGVTRGAVCKALSLDKRYENVVSLMSFNGELPNWRPEKGKLGGFVPNDHVSQTASADKKTRSPHLSDEEFAKKLQEYLDSSLGDEAVSRPNVVLGMGLKKSDTNRISFCINKGLVKGYKITAGRDGGVCRIPAVEAPSAAPELPPDTDPPNASVTDAAELAPQIPADGEEVLIEEDSETPPINTGMFADASWDAAHPDEA